MKIVFTNGVFDIIHRGHIELLEFCKKQGDYLVVALDSDLRVKMNKGKERPINSQNDRKFVLESIKYVNEVILFNDIEELKGLHQLIKPNVVVKGSDWNIDYLRKTDGILDTSEVILYETISGYSTTNLVGKLKCL